MYHGLKSILLVVLLMFSASPALAQTVHVTLQERNGDGAVMGRLVAFSDMEYTIETNAGRVSVNTDTVKCEGRACPMLSLPDLPEIAAKMQRIELSALDGLIDIEGAVLGFVDDHYIVDVLKLGLIKLKRPGLRCSGPGCRVREVLALSTQSPEPVPAEAQEEVPEIALSSFPRMIPVIGERELTKSLLPLLLEGFSQQSGENKAIEAQSQSSYTLRFGSEGNGFLVGASGADATFYSFTVGGADFALSSRRLSNADVSVMEGLGVRDLRNTEYETLIAKDTLNVTVNPDLAIDALQYSQVAAIFRGEVRNWAELGGSDAPIIVIHREPGSAARAVFDDIVFAGTNTRLERSHIIANSTEEMARLLASDPNAIGYLSHSAAIGLKELSLIGSCGLLYVPSAFSTMAGDSPIQSPIYLYSHPDHMNEIGRSFHQYTRSEEGRAALAQSGFSGTQVLRIPLSKNRQLVGLDQLENNAQRTLAKKLGAELPLWDRLSMTFRFPSGTMSLGQSEKADVLRLISYLETLPEGSEISVVGFADASGDFRINQRLSKQRSEFIRDTLASTGGSRLASLKLTSLAFGELAPIRCNTTEHGRAQNRRVEIWVRNTNP